MKQKLLLALSNPRYLLFKWRWGKEVEISGDILIPISFPLQDKHEKIPIIVMLMCSQLDPNPTQVNESSHSFLFSITLHKASRTAFPNSERCSSSSPGKGSFQSVCCNILLSERIKSHIKVWEAARKGSLKCWQVIN